MTFPYSKIRLPHQALERAIINDRMLVVYNHNRLTLNTFPDKDQNAELFDKSGNRLWTVNGMEDHLYWGKDGPEPFVGISLRGDRVYLVSEAGSVYEVDMETGKATFVEFYEMYKNYKLRFLYNIMEVLTINDKMLVVYLYSHLTQDTIPRGDQNAECFDKSGRKLWTINGMEEYPYWGKAGPDTFVGLSLRSTGIHIISFGGYAFRIDMETGKATFAEFTK